MKTYKTFYLQHILVFKWIFRFNRACHVPFIGSSSFTRTKSSWLSSGKTSSRCYNDAILPGFEPGMQIWGEVRIISWTIASFLKRSMSQTWPRVRSERFQLTRSWCIKVFQWWCLRAWDLSSAMNMLDSQNSSRIFWIFLNGAYWCAIRTKHC